VARPVCHSNLTGSREKIRLAALENSYYCPAQQAQIVTGVKCMYQWRKAYLGGENMKRNRKRSAAAALAHGGATEASVSGKTNAVSVEVTVDVPYSYRGRLGLGNQRRWQKNGEMARGGAAGWWRVAAARWAASRKPAE
jgi:hypothetical protein